MKRWVIGRTLIGAALLSCMAGAVMAQLENLPGGMEALRGRHWHGGECCGWTWDWVQVSGPTFSGSFRNANGQTLNEGNIVISITGNQVQITRANGSAAGGCTYNGTIQPGVAEGTYSCAGQPSGRWAATIYQTR